MADNRTPAPEPGMAEAAKRLAILRPFLNGGATLAGVAANAGIPLRTAQHWAARYRENGPAGLARQARSDLGARKLPNDLVALIEGMALTRPRLSAATIHRRVSTIAPNRGWQAPSYGSVYAIINGLGPAMLTLAHEGAAAFRDRYELVHRHRALSQHLCHQPPFRVSR